MSIDLISRALYLKSKGDNLLSEKIDKWLEDSLNIPASEFIAESEKYYWKEISSIQFKDIIDEDGTDWFLIYSENLKFVSITKKHNLSKNLIGKKTGTYLSTLWILKSNIHSINVEEGPMLIYTPYYFDWSTDNLAYDFKLLVIRLMDSKVKLTQIPSYVAPGWHDKVIR
ncbi:hypothetical protein C8P68_1037 [Mucilaginibacter yixingensis]|uniref:Uncharacterized protein n=1 Tax=Mucilaginibacter yixingensis TaxID=1295612 RepID=A0A2T5JAG4_9SPHI|nr:hypothetical protein [Mucilaginibacter yixingensis]PTQ97848.1 hypothetical protein C8P68_1037 [Mucilaginibacter yixingensis]